MANLLLILVCFTAGILMRKYRLLPESAPSVLNTLVIYVALPAAVLFYFRKLPIQAGLLIPVAGMWLIYGVAALIFWAAYRAGWISRSVAGALTLLAGLGNTSFLGIPMILAFLGEEGVPYGIMLDQLGSFLILSTAGMVTAALYSGKHANTKAIIRKIYTFPPLIALCVALLLMQFTLPEAIDSMFGKLAGTLAPLALLAVGYRWKPGSFARHRTALFAGLGYKMVIAPLLVLAMLLLSGTGKDIAFAVTVFEAAMPPMITAAIIADEYGLEADLAASLVGFGIPLSFFALPVLKMLL